MTRTTSEAARLLGVHPFNLVAFAFRMTGGLEEVWPSIDEALVETLRQMGCGDPGTSAASSTESPGSESRGRPPALGVSEAAAKVLDKLERRNHWGSNHVNLDTVRNHFCRGIPGVEEAVEELLDRELLVSVGSRKGPFSLDTRRKGEIDAIVARIRSIQGKDSV